jgi:hypothetical protein
VGQFPSALTLELRALDEDALRDLVEDADGNYYTAPAP